MADSPAWYEGLTIVFVLTLASMVLLWDRRDTTSTTDRAGAIVVVTATAIGLALLAAGLWRWLDGVLWSPIDSSRGDMLVVVREGIHRFLRGRDPYTVYHVPWDAPLPYGPVLWGPYLIPSLLHADLRFVTVSGELFVPACCALAATVEARRAHRLAAALWLGLLAAIVFNPQLAGFTNIGHTPSYWPLLPMFAIFVANEQWRSAAFVLGLLVVGRTTMVAIVPVFALAVWLRARSRAVGAMIIAAATIGALLVPFAIWDPASLWDCMIASYPRVIKGFVWASTGWAQRTIGFTGWLLAHNLQRYVEVTQVGVMLAVYACAWRALKRGASPLPWSAFALLAFSATTLWPVAYVYFDVLLLFASAMFADTVGPMTIRRSVARWATMLTAIAAGVGAVFWMAASWSPALSLASAGARHALYQGFVLSRIDSEPAALIWGLDGTIALPRRSVSAATIVITAQPVILPGAAPQTVTAFVNGTPIGTVGAVRGWQELRFRAPRDVWIAGANAVKLQCATAVTEGEAGLGDDPHHVSLAIRRLDVIEGR